MWIVAPGAATVRACPIVAKPPGPTRRSRSGDGVAVGEMAVAVASAVGVGGDGATVGGGAAVAVGGTGVGTGEASATTVAVGSASWAAGGEEVALRTATPRARLAEARRRMVIRARRRRMGEFLGDGTNGKYAGRSVGATLCGIGSTKS